MKKVLNSFLLLFAIIATAVPAMSLEGGKDGGKLEDVDGVRVLSVIGDPYTMGYQHGKLLENEIKGLLKYFFEDREKIFGSSHENVYKGAQTLVKHIPDRYIQEMKGIADGAGVEYEKILAENVFLDVVSAAWMGVAPQCTNFAMLPEATRDHILIHGRNLDWSADEQLAAMNTVFYYYPQKGIPHLSLSWPGMVGTLTGMNSEKITMGEMTSMSSEATLDGTPIMIHLRMLLESAKNLDDAYTILGSIPRTTGYNVLVTDGKTGTGFIAEMTAKHILRIEPKDGYLLHTNHFVDERLVKTQKKYQYLLGNGKKHETFFRYERLTELIEGNMGEGDPFLAQDFLSDMVNPETGEISEDHTNTVCKKNTLQSVVMLPQSNELFVALKQVPAPLGGYVKLTFSPQIEQDGQ